MRDIGHRDVKNHALFHRISSSVSQDIKNWEKGIIIMYYNCVISFLLFLSDANCIQIKFKPGSIRRMWNSIIWNRVLKESVQCITNCGEIQPALQLTFLTGANMYPASSWKNAVHLFPAEHIGRSCKWSNFHSIKRLSYGRCNKHPCLHTLAYG